jgi:hypothetical protein
MTGGAVAAAGVRAVGVLLLLTTLNGAASWFAGRAVFAGGEELQASRAFVLVSGFQVIVLGAIGLACLFNTSLVVRWLAPELRDQEVQLAPGPFQEVAFSLVGLWLVARSLPYAIQATAGLLWYLGGERRQYLSEVVSQHAAGTIVTAVELVLGLCLLSKPGVFGQAFRSEPDDRRPS